MINVSLELVKFGKLVCFICKLLRHENMFHNHLGARIQFKIRDWEEYKHPVVTTVLR